VLASPFRRTDAHASPRVASTKTSCVIGSG
jgi:hypothetical protein